MRAKYQIVIFLAFAISCDEGDRMSEDEKVQIAYDVRKTLYDYFADIRRGGLKAEFQYLDSSQLFFWVPPGYRDAISYDSVAAILNDRAAQYRSINNRWDTLRINVLHSELAAYTGRLHSVMTDTSGNVAAYNLVETGLLIKRHDRWKLLNGQTTLVDLP